MPAALIVHSGLVLGLLACSMLAIPEIPSPNWPMEPPILVVFPGGEAGSTDETSSPPPLRKGDPEGSRDVAVVAPLEIEPEAPAEVESEAAPARIDVSLESSPSSGLEGSDLKGTGESGSGEVGSGLPYGDPLGPERGSPFGVPFGTGSGRGDGRGDGSGDPGEIHDGRLYPPRLIVKIEPAYPRRAIVARLEGSVTLRVIVDTDGSVREVSVLRSHTMFDRAAVEAIERWRYEPARIGGRPVAVYLTVEVSFVLR